MNKHPIDYIFVNGLGGHDPRLPERGALKYWEFSGTDLQHYPVDWFDGRGFNEVLDGLTGHVENRLAEVGGVALIGSSAAGSLVFNCFARLKDKNVCAISSSSRLAVGDLPNSHRNSLYRRAHLDTDQPSNSFSDSVRHFETVVRPNLTDRDKQRLIILTQLTDLVVPENTRLVDGVQTHRSNALGHSGGFLAHLYADKHIITRFAEYALVA